MSTTPEKREAAVVVGSDVAVPLVSVFRRLYQLRFPIRHMRLHDFYAGPSAYPKDRDITASFECRQAVPSPCVGGTASGHWSNHAYGHAIDLDPVRTPTSVAGRPGIRTGGSTSTVPASERGWSHQRSCARSPRSAGAGAGSGPARRRTTCTSRSTGTDHRPARAAGRRPAPAQWPAGFSQPSRTGAV